MGVRYRRAVRPQLDRCEPRELLSSIGIVLAGAQTPQVSAAAALAARVQQTGWSVVGGDTSVPTATATATTTASAVSAASTAGGTVNTGGTTLPQGNGFSGNTSSPLLGDGTPTPHELLREAFRAGFQGRAYSSPGRFSNQAATWFIRGTGGSTFFLHGDFNMAVVIPTDPNAMLVGEAVLNDKSTGTSGTLGLILTGSRADLDAQGRPTRMTFTADPNIYSGAFAVSAAEGTVTIRYGRGSSRPTSVVFDGRVYTSGLTNPLINTDMYARHNRPLVFRGPSAARRT